MATLQEHYNLIKEGKGNKDQFLKQARLLFPQYVTKYLDFDTTTNVLKSKQVISEAVGGVVSKGFDIYDWKKILSEETKAEEKNPSKEVNDNQKHNFDSKDTKNVDNINFNEIMKGFYAELNDEKNKGKTGDEIKAMVVKNLAKDPLHYTKTGEFGTKGTGYTKDAPGLGETKPPVGKHKSLGYGDLKVTDPEAKEEKVKANVKDTLGNQEAKTTMPKKVKEMPVAPQNSKGVKKMALPGKPKTIKPKVLKENQEVYVLKENDIYSQIADLEIELMNCNDASRKSEIEAKIKTLEGGIENLNELNPDIDGLENFELMLQKHDWYYENSDDDRVWEKGNKEEKELKEIAKSLGEEGIALYNKYYHQSYPNSSWSLNEEIKLRSVISKIIKEELNSDKWENHLEKLKKGNLELNKMLKDRGYEI